jgi:2-polyprenyl-6-hydroxyphenyl methylase/3-demethylubiquinone-9 3-methyltransferase
MNDHPSGAYYGEKLSAERLRRCYELAPARVQQYLAAEIRFVREDLSPGQVVLELGCGYGRVLDPIAGRGRRVVGIDTAMDSLKLAADRLRGVPGCTLAAA